MFSNITENCLWDIAKIATKQNDVNTARNISLSPPYDEMGTTERFLISAGRLVNDLMTKIEELFSYGDMFNINKDFLKYIQRNYDALYILVTSTDEKIVRNMMEEIVNAWKLKGTAVFLRWIIWKVFGWTLTIITALSSDVLKLSISSSFIYDPDLPYDENKLLYDETLMVAVGTILLTVDVSTNGDTAPQVADKKITFEELIEHWTLNAQIIYINEP